MLSISGTFWLSYEGRDFVRDLLTHHVIHLFHIG